MEGGKVNPEIFRAYDIRGKYPEDFDAAFAQRLGNRVAAHLKAGILVVGRDMRPGSDELAHAVADGALHVGAEVIDVGDTSTPQFQWAVRALGAKGGIMVTASHLPPEYNGFKVMGGRGEVIGGDYLRQVYDSQESGHRPGGTLRHHDVVADYADAVAYASGWKGGTELNIAIDGPPSVRRVLERLGPIAPTSDLSARFDMDADRIQFFSSGRPIPADFIFLLLTERFRLAPVAFDLRFSRVVRESLDAAGVQYAVSRVGRLYLTEAMRRSGAALGGEMSGHFYWKEFGGMESPELTLVRFLQAIQQDPARLEKLLEPYRRYAKSDELNIPMRDRKNIDSVLNQVVAHYPSCVSDHSDGITVDCWEARGFWFNIRASNTEPLMRIVVEAKQKNLLDSAVQEVRELVG